MCNKNPVTQHRVNYFYYFLANLCKLPDGLLCIAFCLSVCIKNSLEKNHITKSIVPRVMKLGIEIDLDDLSIDLEGQLFKQLPEG